MVTYSMSDVIISDVRTADPSVDWRRSAVIFGSVNWQWICFQKNCGCRLTRILFF